MAGKPNPPKIYARECTGRPSMFTPERRAAIVFDISRRVPYEFAAEANGITEETLYAWLRIALDHKNQGIVSDYTIFSADIKAAERDRIVQHNQNISDHVDKWQGDAWILERRWHKHYSTNASVIELNQRLNKIENTEQENGKGFEENGSEEGKED